MITGCIELKYEKMGSQNLNTQTTFNQLFRGAKKY